MAVALSELQRRVLDRMDEGQSEYVTPQQCTDVINEAYSQLWGIYVDRAPIHIQKDYTFTSVVAQRDYALPADFRRAIKLFQVSNGRYIALHTFTPERYGRWGNCLPDYELLGANIRINHPPGIPCNYEMWYIPHYTPLVNSIDTLDPRIFPGHEQWIVTQATITLKIGKEEQPADDLIAQNERVRSQIDNDLIMRDLGEHSRVVMHDRYQWYDDPWYQSACSANVGPTSANVNISTQPSTGGSGTSTTTSTPTSAPSSNGGSTSTSTGTSTGTSTSTSTPTSTGTSTGTSTSTPSAGGAGTATPTRTYSAVYKNGTQSGWQNDNNYGGTYAIAGDSRVANGVSISGTVAQYGAFNFYSTGGNLNVNNYLGIQFDAYSASGAPQLRVQVDPGNNQSPIVSEIVTLTTGWATYTVYYTDSQATNSSSVTSTFSNLEFVNMSAATTPTVYLNNISMIVNPSPPVATYSLVATDPSPASTTTGWLHVKGNQFYDSTNTVWMGRGVNCPDTRLDGKSYSITPQTSVVPELTRRIQWLINQGADFFRLLLDMRNSSDDIANNTDYLNAIKQVVNYIGGKGCRVMISCWNDWTCTPFGNGQSGQPTTASLTHWSQIATSFRNSGHVLYGLCNEPRSNDTPALLAAYTSITNQCISVIRQVEQRDGAQPHMIIVQGSSSYSRNIPYFLTNPATDPSYPITNSTSVGYIGYEVHCYEAPSYWQSEFESSATSIPLIVGEFGPNDPNGTMVLNSNEDDVTPLMTYCSQKNIPYCAWTFDYNSPPDMLVNNSTDGSYGVNQTLQWTQPWGITFINNLRAQKGLTGTVDVYGNVSGASAGGAGSSTNSSGSSSNTGSSSGTYTSTYIYQNGIQSGWQDNSYSGSYGTGSDSRTTGGVAKTAAIQQYGAVNFYHAAQNVTSFKGIRFDAFSASGAPALRVQIDSGDVTSPIVYEMETIGGTWATYTILWTDTSAVGTPSGTFTDVEFANLAASTTPAININNVCLLS